MGLTKTLLMISFRKASHCSILFSQCPYPILAMVLNFEDQNFRTFFILAKQRFIENFEIQQNWPTNWSPKIKHACVPRYTKYLKNTRSSKRFWSVSKLQ